MILRWLSLGALLALASGQAGCGGAPGAPPGEPSPSAPATASTTAPAEFAQPPEANELSPTPQEPEAVAEPVREPTPETKPETPQLEGGGQQPGTGKRCTIKDSNGPLPGGTSTSSGCGPGEVCQCNYQAGYSCGGECVLKGR